MTGVLMRERERRLEAQRQTANGHVKLEAEIGVMEPHTIEHQGLPAARS